MKKDPRIDAYIEKAQPFAKPILKKLRALVHKGCPQVEETIKWGMPCFEYKGALCGLGSFKQHVTLGFWKTALLNDSKGYLQEHKAKGGEAMGNLGRITSLNDLPPDEVLIDFVKQSAKLNEDGIKLPPKAKTDKTELLIPDYFATALSKNPKAKTVFDNFAYSHRKEYLQWITEAKTEATRQKRMATAIEWLAEGKGRNWKYERKQKLWTVISITAFKVAY
ncbi:MAG: YdeI/OmpD-associated family protein [Chitinophagales bacterium]|nr:YdeI/OmpD-associated family protein [Chitinophagales bacterium]